MSRFVFRRIIWNVYFLISNMDKILQGSILVRNCSSLLFFYCNSLVLSAKISQWILLNDFNSKCMKPFILITIISNVCVAFLSFTVLCLPPFGTVTWYLWLYENLSYFTVLKLSVNKQKCQSMIQVVRIQAIRFTQYFSSDRYWIDTSQ